MSQLNQAVVLITGAAGGFGQQFTKQLLAANSYLILSDRSSEIVEETAEKITKEVNTGKIIATLNADLATAEGCISLYEKVQTLNTPVDILINNAGIGLFGRMDEVPWEKWQQMMQVNLLAPMQLSSLFASQMIKRQQGHIVNISSVAGLSATAGLAHYSASKFGLRGFGEGLREELKPYNIKVTTVYPFFSRTPILRSQKYGSLAKNSDIDYLESIATNPVDIVKRVIQGIRQNKAEVLPDSQAKGIYLIMRYFPALMPFLANNLSKKMRII